MPDDVRSTPRSSWLRPVLFHVGGPMCRRLFRLRVEGNEHLPAAGAAIIAANHLSFFDSIALALAVRRPLRFVGKAEYLDSWKTRRLFPALGMIPVDRASPRQAYGALPRRRPGAGGRRALRRLPRRHPVTGRRLARGAQRRRPLEHDDRCGHHPRRHRGHRPDPAARRTHAPALPSGGRALRFADRSAGLRREPAASGAGASPTM